MVTYDARPSQFVQLTTTYEWEKLFAVMGIFDGIDGTDFAPSLDVTGRNIVVQPGTCIIKGQMWRSDAVINTPVTANSGGAARTDILVIQYNRAAGTQQQVVQLVLKPGTTGLTQQSPGAGPNAQGTWEIPVATVVASANNGQITGLFDMRQYSGRSVISMTSTWRPSPPHPVLGLETDTGYLLRWNGTAWQSIGPKNQVWNSISGVNMTAVNSPGTPLHSYYTFPAGDVFNSTLGQVAYHIKVGGSGKMSTGYRTGFVFETWGFNIHWGATTTGDTIPLGGAFNWYYDATMIINQDGSGVLIGSLNLTYASATPGNAQSTYVLMDKQPAGTFKDNVAFNLYVAAYASGSGSGTAGTLTCYGSTCERNSN